MWGVLGLLVAGLYLSVTINACPDCQTTIHIQNYDGPIIVLTTCDPSYRNVGTSYQHDSDCTCVSRNCYNPSQTYGCENDYYAQNGYAQNSYIAQNGYNAQNSNNAQNGYIAQNGYQTLSYGCGNQFSKDDGHACPVGCSYGSTVCNRIYPCTGYYS